MREKMDQERQRHKKNAMPRECREAGDVSSSAALDAAAIQRPTRAHRMQQDTKAKRGAGRATLALGTERNGTDEITAKTALLSQGSSALPAAFVCSANICTIKYSFKPLDVTPE